MLQHALVLACALLWCATAAADAKPKTKPQAADYAQRTDVRALAAEIAQESGLPKRDVERWLAAARFQPKIVALMDRPLLDAFGYRPPPAAVVAAARAGLRARARVEALLPARRTPVHFVDSPRMRSYPDGYDVDRLGTFPRGCPVAH